ncbi:MAG: hypothetical protein FJ143_15025 [Deltaproteobacteria bacterium]|nr:hypothetical protein [Deltaproteobacteria bacterium]
MGGLLRNFARMMALAILLWLAGIGGAVAQPKATVFGTATANLRAGAGVEHALKMTLKEGDQVSVEKLDGDWYLVSAADGQKGYVHKNLLKLAADTPAQSAPPQTPPVTTAPLEAKESAKDAPPPAAPANVTPTAPGAQPKQAPANPPQAADAKSQSILQMIEGHETEVKIGLIIAAMAFALGWLCGGGYYARRERKSRHKLRF